MRNAVKDRLIIFGLVLACLLFVLCFVPSAHTTLEAWLNLRPWAHMTLEASLNLLWVVLAFCALLHWVAPRSSRRGAQVRGLVTLVFVLSLLFPVISADDDLAQLDLLNDAKTSQALVRALQSDQHLPVWVGLIVPAEVWAVQSACFLPSDYGLVSEPLHLASVAIPGGTTGNHSPPLC